MLITAVCQYKVRLAEVILLLDCPKFKVESQDGKAYLTADFGESASGRVPPVDSCLWWILLLRTYVKTTGDLALAYQPEFQEEIKLILDLCLVHRFAMYPTMLVPDGAFTIDRRMGVYGHPWEIQVLLSLNR